MQAIARENNLSGTAFVRHSSLANFGVRHFTTEEEIPMAGHLTTATSFALVETGHFPLSGDRILLMLELQVGPIRVDFYTQAGKVQQIVMSETKPQFVAKHDPVEELTLCLDIPCKQSAWARPT
jgi:trans-2,3-dihydro-3-hydroxyanthranilate isomerase